MDDLPDRAYFGPYQLVRSLGPSMLADRYLALHVRSKGSFVVHRFRSACTDRAQQRRLTAALERMSHIRHPHLLGVENFSFAPGGRPLVVTPYTGNQDGLITLADLLDLKGGQMGAFEAERAILQLLDAVSCSHSNGMPHGELGLDEVLVDRRGSVFIELAGLRLAISGRTGQSSELLRDETRSIAQIGYRLITGLPADEPFIPPTSVVRRLDRRWDEWFETALEPSGGFETPSDAIDALPGNRREQARDTQPGPVRVVLQRLGIPGGA